MQFLALPLLSRGGVGEIARSQSFPPAVYLVKAPRGKKMQVL